MCNCWALGSVQQFLSSLFPDHFVMWHLWDTHSTLWGKRRDGHVWKGCTTGIAGNAAPCVCIAWGSTGDLRLNASAKGTLWKACSTKPCCRNPKLTAAGGCRKACTHGCTQGRCCKQDFWPQYRGYVKSAFYYMFLPSAYSPRSLQICSLRCLPCTISCGRKIGFYFEYWISWIGHQQVGVLCVLCPK